MVIEDNTDDTKIEGLTKSLEHLDYVVTVVVEKDEAEPSEQVARAAEFLKSLFPEFYADGDYWRGPILVTELEALGADQDFGPDILRRAREHLGWGSSFKAKEVRHSSWYTHPWITKDDT